LQYQAKKTDTLLHILTHCNPD